MKVFEDTVIKWFHDSARLWERKALFHAVWERDEEKLTEEMTKLLRKTISYHDYKEEFFTMLFWRGFLPVPDIS